MADFEDAGDADNVEEEGAAEAEAASSTSARTIGILVLKHFGTCIPVNLDCLDLDCLRYNPLCVTGISLYGLFHPPDTPAFHRAMQRGFGNVLAQIKRLRSGLGPFEAKESLDRNWVAQANAFLESDRLMVTVDVTEVKEKDSSHYDEESDQCFSDDNKITWVLYLDFLEMVELVPFEELATPAGEASLSRVREATGHSPTRVVGTRSSWWVCAYFARNFHGCLTWCAYNYFSKLFCSIFAFMWTLLSMFCCASIARERDSLLWLSRRAARSPRRTRSPRCAPQLLKSSLRAGKRKTFSKYDAPPLRCLCILKTSRRGIRRPSRSVTAVVRLRLSPTSNGISSRTRTRSRPRSTALQRPA